MALNLAASQEVAELKMQQIHEQLEAKVNVWHRVVKV
jgi:hypothetical protein